MPALLGLELALLAVALRQGWGRHKVRGWWWLVRNRRLVRERRARVQSERSVPDETIAGLLTSRFDPGEMTGLRAPAALRVPSEVYWRLVRRALGGASPTWAAAEPERQEPCLAPSAS
jgi:hypothetical protein